MSVQELQLNNNRAISLLYRLGNILAIIPPIKYLDKSSFLNNNYKCYAICVVLVIIILDVVVIVGRSIDVYPTSPSYTVVLTDIMLNIGLTGANISAVIVPSLIRRDTFKIFYDTLIRVDFYFPILKKREIEKIKPFYMELIIGNLAIILLFSCDAYIWINRTSFALWRHYIFRNFQAYHLYITIIIIYKFVLSIKLKLATMNGILNDLIHLSQPSANTTNNCLTIAMKKPDSSLTVRKISQMFEVQIQQLHLFNKLFGWQILFQALTIMLALLNAADLLAAFIFLSGQDDTMHQGYDLIILSALWSLWHIILEIIVIGSCAQVSQEAQKTADVCFSILLKLDVECKNTRNRILKKELQLLSTMAIHRFPNFTAADFFPVNCSLILTVFGSVTTYAIVLIQFNK